MANHYDSIPELRTANKDSEGGELEVGSVNWAQYLYTEEDGSDAWDQGLQVTSTGEYLQQGDLTGKAGWGAPILYFDTSSGTSGDPKSMSPRDSGSASLLPPLS